MDIMHMVERGLYMLPELLAVFIAIYCISRGTGTDAILMIIGAPLDLLCSFASIVLWEVIFDGGSFGSIEVYNKAINYTGIAARLLFFSGMLLFAMAHARRPVQQRIPPPPPWSDSTT